ncbi:MAG: hypothetical protein IPK79_01820 [Vampirovibrionales bacterium]|nr:hypothetical protein [Vampirovibrionales bacterium]
MPISFNQTSVLRQSSYKNVRFAQQDATSPEANPALKIAMELERIAMGNTQDPQLSKKIQELEEVLKKAPLAHVQAAAVYLAEIQKDSTIDIEIRLALSRAKLLCEAQVADLRVQEELGSVDIHFSQR